jgi:hypothetical protein
MSSVRGRGLLSKLTVVDISRLTKGTHQIDFEKFARSEKLPLVVYLVRMEHRMFVSLRQIFF